MSLSFPISHCGAQNIFTSQWPSYCDTEANLKLHSKCTVSKRAGDWVHIQKIPKDTGIVWGHPVVFSFRKFEFGCFSFHSNFFQIICACVPRAPPPPPPPFPRVLRSNIEVYIALVDLSLSARVVYS